MRCSTSGVSSTSRGVWPANSPSTATLAPPGSLVSARMPVAGVRARAPRSTGTPASMSSCLSRLAKPGFSKRSSRSPSRISNTPGVVPAGSPSTRRVASAGSVTTLTSAQAGSRASARRCWTRRPVMSRSCSSGRKRGASRRIRCSPASMSASSSGVVPMRSPSMKTCAPVGCVSTVRRPGSGWRTTSTRWLSSSVTRSDEA